MAWSYVGRIDGSTAVASGDFTVNGTFQAKTSSGFTDFAEGDLLIAGIAHRGNAAFANADWQEIVETLSGNTTADTTAAIASLSFYYCIRGASAPSLVFTRTGGDLALGTIVGYRGVAASPLDTSSSSTLGTASTTASTGTITTAENDELLVAFVSIADNPTLTSVGTFDAVTGATVGSGNTVNTASDPTSNTWILRHRDASGTGADGAFALGEAIMSTAGATGTVSAAVVDNGRHAMAVAAFKLSSVPPVTGTLAATESGSDTFAGTGAVTVSGVLASNETGADSLAATGEVLISGALASTEAGADVAAFTAEVAVAAALAATESGADVFAATAGAVVTGALAAVETGSDTAAVVASVEVSGVLAASETGADVFAATAGAVVTGTLAAVEIGSDSAAVVASVAVSGALAAAEAGLDVFAAIGSLDPVPLFGTLAAVETGSDVFVASGAVSVSGSLAVAETGADVFAAVGSLESVPLFGTLAAVETGSDVFAASGVITVSGSLAVSETGADVFAAVGNLEASPITGFMAASESEADDFTAFVTTGMVPRIATLAAVETGSDVFTSTGLVLVSGTLAAIETGQDVFSGAYVSGSLRLRTASRPGGMQGPFRGDIVQGFRSRTNVQGENVRRVG